MFISQQLILINRIKNKANRFFDFVSLILFKKKGKNDGMAINKR